MDSLTLFHGSINKARFPSLSYKGVRRDSMLNLATLRSVSPFCKQINSQFYSVVGGFLSYGTTSITLGILEAHDRTVFSGSFLP